MKPPKKGRARRAKAKVEKVVTYNLRSEFAHLALQGWDSVIVTPFDAKATDWSQEITVKFHFPPVRYGVLSDYGVKP